MPIIITFNHRPKWIKKFGIKYQKSDFVLVGWQRDDLPIFGQLQDILVAEKVLFKVLKYENMGIDRHYHSYTIQRTPEEVLIWFSDIVDHQIYQGHTLTSNSNTYVTLHSHIEKIVK